MSKRKTQTAVGDYIAQGFIREALVNYLALLGWATGTEEEVLSLPEIVERFDSAQVHKGGAVFDRERLEWLNGQWIRRLDADDLIDRLRPFLEADRRSPAGSTGCRRDDEVRALLPVIQERLPTLGAIGDLVGFLWVDELDLDAAAARAQALGRRRRRGMAWPPRGRSSPRWVRSPSRPTSWSRRCGRSPRRAAGRSGTCSWRSGSRSPAGPRRRRCSTRSSRWVVTAPWPAWTVRPPRSRRRDDCRRRRRAIPTGGWRRTALPVGVGLVTGVLTQLGQGLLPGGTSQVANAISPWLLVTFLVGAVMTSRMGAVAAGIATLAFALVGYYAMIELRFGYGASTSSLLFWGLGAAGRWRGVRGRGTHLAPRPASPLAGRGPRPRGRRVRRGGRATRRSSSATR